MHSIREWPFWLLTVSLALRSVDAVPQRGALEGHRPRVLVQVFQREHSVLGGVDEALAILRLCAGRGQGLEWVPGWPDLVVQALYDGDTAEPWETVLTIEGDYDAFCHLETLYLGVLARRTLISRNVRDVVEAARGKGRVKRGSLDGVTP